VRHLLLAHLDGQEDAGQAVRDLQEAVSPHLSVQVVSVQRAKRLSSVQESD
jgi:hypothetical protein